MRKEDREPLNDIAVAVIDRSQSQEYRQSHSPRPTRSKAPSRTKPAGRLGNTELRIVDVHSGITAGNDGTAPFDAPQPGARRYSAGALCRRHHGDRRRSPRRSRPIPPSAVSMRPRPRHYHRQPRTRSTAQWSSSKRRVSASSAKSRRSGSASTTPAATARPGERHDPSSATASR